MTETSLLRPPYLKKSRTVHSARTGNGCQGMRQDPEGSTWNQQEMRAMNPTLLDGRPEKVPCELCQVIPQKISNGTIQKNFSQAFPTGDETGIPIGNTTTKTQGKSEARRERCLQWHFPEFIPLKKLICSRFSSPIKWLLLFQWMKARLSLPPWYTEVCLPKVFVKFAWCRSDTSWDSSSITITHVCTRQDWRWVSWRSRKWTWRRRHLILQMWHNMTFRCFLIWRGNWMVAGFLTEIPSLWPWMKYSFPSKKRIYEKALRRGSWS